MCFFFFFFQAEDGIRDLYVTGVQTCALPILLVEDTRREAAGARVHAARIHEGRGALSRALPRARRRRQRRQLDVGGPRERSEEHTSELQSRRDLVCRLLLEKKKKIREEQSRI